jgi:hypothetical protein
MDAAGRLRRVRTDRQPGRVWPGKQPRLFETGCVRGFVLHGTGREPRPPPIMCVRTPRCRRVLTVPSGPVAVCFGRRHRVCPRPFSLAENRTERRGLSQTGAATSDAAAYKCRSRARLKGHHGSPACWHIASASERAEGAAGDRLTDRQPTPFAVAE